MMTAYSHKLRLKYSAAQLFDLVADVERYPEFIPWTITTRVRRRTDRVIWTDFTIGTGFIRKRFSTVATLERPHRIAITSQDPLFERFEQRWTFEDSSERGTDVEYRTEFQFRSFLLQALLDMSFADHAAAIVSAYTRRAHRLYGTSST
jgi:coenzyme Q-binding protein COQ10